MTIIYECLIIIFLAHLLMAQIQLHQGNYLNAQQSLEVGLSYNFEVRDHPLFHLVSQKNTLSRATEGCFFQQCASVAKIHKKLNVLFMHLILQNMLSLHTPILYKLQNLFPFIKGCSCRNECSSLQQLGNPDLLVCFSKSFFQLPKYVLLMK